MGSNYTKWDPWGGGILWDNLKVMKLKARNIWCADSNGAYTDLNSHLGVGTWHLIPTWSNGIYTFPKYLPQRHRWWNVLCGNVGGWHNTGRTFRVEIETNETWSLQKIQHQRFGNIKLLPGNEDWTWWTECICLDWQCAYTESLLEKFGMKDCNPISSKLTHATDKDDCINQPQYQSAIGSLMYLSVSQIYESSQLLSKIRI